MSNRCVADGAQACNVDPNGDFVECVECETEVRWDMQDHRSESARSVAATARDKRIFSFWVSEEPHR